MKKHLFSMLLCTMLLLPILVFHAEAAPAWYVELIHGELASKQDSRAVAEDYDGDGVEELIILHTGQSGINGFEIWKYTENGPVCVAKNEDNRYSYRAIRLVTYENHDYIVTYSTSNGGNYLSYAFYDPLNHYEKAHLLTCIADIYEPTEYQFDGKTITNNKYTEFTRMINAGPCLLDSFRYGTPLKELAPGAEAYTLVSDLNENKLTVTRGQEFGILFQLYKGNALVEQWDEPEYSIENGDIVEIKDLCWDPEKSWFMTLEGLSEGECTITVTDHETGANVSAVITVEKGGFSAELDGWSILNSRYSFCYDKNYAFDKSLYIDLGVSEEYSKKDKWPGNCFGLSMLAVAQYNEQIDLKELFRESGILKGYYFNTFAYNNIYVGYDAKGNLWESYALRFKIQDKIHGNDAAVSLVEWAELSQLTAQVKNCIVFSDDEDYSGILAHLNQDNAKPIMIGLRSIETMHTVVTDTTSKPVFMGDGWYAISVYDSNAPRTKVPLDNPLPNYTQSPSQVWLNVNNGKWRYYFNGNVYADAGYTAFGIDYITFYDISQLDPDFLSSQPLLEIPNGTFYYSAADLYVCDNSGTLLFEQKEEPRCYSDQVSYHPFYGSDEGTDAQRGILNISTDEHLVKTTGEALFEYYSDALPFVCETKGDAVITFSGQNDTFLLHNDGSDELQFDLVVYDPDGNHSLTGKGNLSAGRDIEIKADWDSGEISVQTDDDLNQFHTVLELDGKPVQEDIQTPAEDPEKGFVDVDSNKFYAVPVHWAVENGVTKGIDDTHFAPNDKCTRAQVVTFLWRAAGSPEPTYNENPFVDVIEGKFYYKAVLWAVEEGITNGVDATHFGTNNECTRGHVATFLWRTLGKPVASGTNPFEDVPAGKFYYDAVLWAAESGVTSGVSTGKFDPNGICTRGQIVTFLYRALAD